MSQRDVVIGVEMFLGQRGKCLQCDTCNVVYDGGNGIDKLGPICVYRELNGDQIRQDAVQLGWTCKELEGKEVDYCPRCSPKNSKAFVPPDTINEILVVEYQAKDLHWRLQQHHHFKVKGDVKILTAGWPELIQAHKPALLELVIWHDDTPGTMEFPGVEWRNGFTPISHPNAGMIVHLWSWGGDKVFGAQVLAHLK